MSIIKKTITGCIIGTAVCTVLYYGALFSLPKLINLNDYKDNFAQQLENQTGFKLSCENIQFKRSLSPYLKIYMYHTLVLYPDDEIFLKLKESEIKVKILPLILKKLVIKDAKLTRPIINVTLYKDFSTSLEKYIDTAKVVNANGFNLNAVISDTLCANYKLKIFDESINKEFYLEGEKLLLKNIKPNENAHIILKGALFQDKREYLKYDIDLTSALNKEKKPFTFSPFKSIYESDVKGNITGRVKIDKDNNVNGDVQINDLSLNVEDIRLKNNSINLIFKGEEAEINSLLHTSLKDKVELNGKFNYGKKRYIDLHTVAKNTNLSNLSKVIKELSEILNIDNPLKDMVLKGLLNADFSINSDFKKLKSQGSAQVKNAVLTYQNLPYKLTDINADINFNDNKIRIENAGLKVNSTPVNITGYINQDVTADLNLSADNLDLKTVTSIFLKDKNLPVNILKGKLSFKSQVKGSLNKTLTSLSDINLSGVSFIEKTQAIPITINSSEITLKTEKDKYSGEINCSGNAKYNKSLINTKDFGFTFDNKEIKIPSKEIFINSSPVYVSGVIKNYMQKPEINIDYKADLKAGDIGIILSQYIKEPYKAVGIIKTFGVYTYKDGISKIKAQLKADKNNYISYLVIKELLNKPSILNVDTQINDKNITIKDISLLEQKQNASKIINITGQIINDKTLVLKNLRLQIPSTLTMAMNFFGGEEASFNADVTLNNSITNPKIIGNAKIYKYNIKKFLTSIKDANVFFADNLIKITAPDVQINDSLFNVSLDMLPPILNTKNISVNNMQINSLNLDLNSLFQLQNNIEQIPLIIKKGTATINNFQVLDLKAKDISSDFTLEKNTIKLSNIIANAYSGQVFGKLNYDILNHSLDINMSGKGLDIKTSLYDLCKLEDNLGGRADFQAQVSLLTGEEKEVLKSIKGKLNFKSQNGKMGTLGKFEYYLYAKNLLYHGILNTTLNRVANAIVRDNTSMYREASGDLTFDNGYIITENLTTIGQNMSLYMTGRQNMLTNQANIDIYGRISDEITNKLGSFGNVSISDMMNSKQDKKNTIMRIPNEIMDKIPNLYKKSNETTNTFKVNIYGDINSLNAINSFMWTLPKEETSTSPAAETLPSFSDL